MALKPDPADVETLRENPPVRGRDSIAAASTIDMQAPVGAFDSPADRFAELGELGRGGMGRVIDAYDRALGRSVAVKMIMSTDQTDLARFEREAQITARLEHPGIVPIHDAGRDTNGQPYYVMRKVDGRPLSELVDVRAFGARLALVPNVLAACDAVAFAHARRVIHRDIKPTNILVGPFGETLVIDWGLARAYDLDEQLAEGPAPILDSHPELTRAGAVAGTPGFMAPEQARGETIDARADVYALGATLYYVLTGKLAFRTHSATEILTRVGANQDADWSQLDASTPADLIAILKKAMAPVASSRYADAGELAADLRQYVTGKLVGARDYTWYEQLGRFASRHKPVIAVAAIALVIIAVGATLSVRRVIAERDAAEQARKVALAGQREATAKRDELLVRHAMDLAESDPAAAIAVLRRLALDSTQWRAASVAAGAAMARGIPRGYSYPAQVMFTSFSPRGERLLVQLADKVLWVQEVPSGERSRIGTFDASSLQWIDERTIVGTTSRAVVVIDTETTTAREVPAGTRPSVVVIGGGGYVLSEGTVHAFDSTMTTLGPALATGLDQAATVSGYGVVHLVGNRVHLMTPTGDRELAGNLELEGSVGITGIGPTVMATTRTQNCVWNPAPDGFGHCSPKLGPMAVVGTTVAAARGNALVSELPNGGSSIIIYPGSVSRLFPTANGRGAVALTHQGTIFVALPTHTIELPPRPPGYQRATTSMDDRYLAAVSSTEVMLYDLAQQNLTPYSAPGAIAAINSVALYTIENFLGVNRVAVDGTRERLDMPPDAYHNLMVDPTDRWLVADGSIDAHQYIRDATTKQVVTLRSHDFALLDRYPVIVGAEGQLATMETGTLTELAKLDGAPLAASLRGDWLGVALSDGRVCRVDLRTDARICTALPTTPESIAIDARGGMWLASGTRLWRWDGVLLVYDELESRIVELAPSDRYVIAQLANAIYVHDGTTGRILPLSVTGARVASEDRLVASSGNGRLRVIDLPTGLGYDVFSVDMVADPPAVAGSTIAVRRPGESIFRFDLTVPTEPAALRKWLHEVTNLVDLSDSEVVAWPTP